MANLLLPILAGDLPPGTCFPATPQELLVLFADNMQALLANGMAFYSYGTTTPDPAYQSYPWLRQQDMRWYYYSGGWISPNPETDANARRLFVGTEAQVWSYDGGDGNNPDPAGPTPPGPSTGAMWEVDHDFDGRSPMGPGDVVGVTPVATLGVAANYGSGGITLLQNQLPATLALTASLPGNRTNLEGGAPQWLAPTGSGGTIATTPASEDGSFSFVNAGGAQLTNVVHGVRGCFVIMRTARANYTA